MPDQPANGETSRLDAEWITAAAVRGLTKLATRGGIKNSTYDAALEFGGDLYPSLLGPDTSIIRRSRESYTAKEFRQEANLRSKRDNIPVTPVDLIHTEIKNLKELIALAENDRAVGFKADTDKLKNKLGRLISAEKELNPTSHSEHQLIFRDVYNADWNLPSMGLGQAHRDFRLPHGNILRVRLLHPDKPEHITGADVIYERHLHAKEQASIVAVQYKIWDDKTLYLSDERMHKQFGKLRAFLCDKGLCARGQSDGVAYRFPFCAAFLRPTDKLQFSDQTLKSSGEHLPICLIDNCASKSQKNADILDMEHMRETSLNTMMFDVLFNRGKIGSRLITYPELTKLYSDHLVALSEDSVVIHAQEFPDPEETEFDEEEFDL